ncbi:dihydrofolate reductase family protein [Propionimicrobium sp. PCR01-08-3]|uniref:dihydrofolate reductase family protein n=1 Tax=Propionimicrobium sp. PCR01-08-3 TaxID=3052086 RepID=UPI00255C3174|nr:dihydrofolate reductase family protein [Propionimicrobium sp. PCR01-08-3]WIY83953.1 dihydrofolate reductase family protein [Propionimicrobium sp. PCR01-08-3]
MTTHFYTASSLDGFIATADHSLEWLFAQDFDMEGPMAYPDFIKGMGAIVMGASTYEWSLAHQETWEYTQPVWVFTHRSLPTIGDADVRFVQGGVSEAYADIAASARGKDIWVVGGGDLAGQFADAGLLDEVWFQFASVTLGSGQPLLPRNLRLELLDWARNRDFLCGHYRVVKDR